MSCVVGGCNVVATEYAEAVECMSSAGSVWHVRV